MLKIKDNVDLKVLKRYGFKKYKHYYSLYDEDDYSDIGVDCDDRKIWIACDGCYPSDLDKIFDLISAGLVEKVE